MKETVAHKIKQLSLEAKQKGDAKVKATLASGNTTALSKAIKTKEQADLFMKMLKSL
jgi:hypothetical protein